MTSDQRDQKDIVDEFTEISRQDDCFRHMIPSDVRRLLGEIERLRADRDRFATIVERARNGDPQLIDGIEDFMAIEAAAEQTK